MKKSVLITGVRTVEGPQGEFAALDLETDDLRVSKTTKKVYHTTIKASITTTLSPEQAQRLIGQELEGEIVKVDRKPDLEKYPDSKGFPMWKNPRTEELVMITTQNEFVPAAK